MSANYLINAMNALFISMLGDEEIPIEAKPKFVGNARKDTLSSLELDFLLSGAPEVAPITNWLRKQYPEMARGTILNSTRVNTDTHYITPVAVYVEPFKNAVLIKMLGRPIYTAHIRDQSEPLVGQEELELALQNCVVFYGPAADSVATWLTPTLLEVIRVAWKYPEDYDAVDTEELSVTLDALKAGYLEKYPDNDKATPEVVEMLEAIVPDLLAALVGEKRKHYKLLIEQLYNAHPKEFLKVTDSLNIAFDIDRFKSELRITCTYL